VRLPLLLFLVGAATAQRPRFWPR